MGDIIDLTKSGVKFADPVRTASGDQRAEVRFAHLQTLWINTGTLCNIECANCYIESSPTNDRLTYITAEEAGPLIDEAVALGAEEIGFTGGEPFMNPAMFSMLDHVLRSDLRALVLTNAMRPMMRPRTQDALVKLVDEWPEKLALRVSLDHYTADLHDKERGAGSFDEAMRGLAWLAAQGARLSVAGRSCLSETEDGARAGYGALFQRHGLPIGAADPAQLVLFPEMDAAGDPPEITEACWDILGKSPDEIMCATSRMVVKRKGDTAPSVLACTLIPYSDEFNFGRTLREATTPVKLNHPNCATFCVLGGSNCSA